MILRALPGAKIVILKGRLKFAGKGGAVGGGSGRLLLDGNVVVARLAGQTVLDSNVAASSEFSLRLHRT